MRIMNKREQVLRRKTVRLLKVLWQYQGVEEATWECEDTMRATYPFLFEDEGTLFSNLEIQLLLHMNVIVCICVLISGKKFILRRGKCKTRKKKFQFF